MSYYRNTGIGLGSIFARVGGMLSPYASILVRLLLSSNPWNNFHWITPLHNKIMWCWNTDTIYLCEW